MAWDFKREGQQGEQLISRGIETIPVDQLLALHQDRIDHWIDGIAPETPELRNALHRTLVNFANWVHQLPASEHHHHSYSGGLLEHSLEVAQWSSQSARGRLGDLRQTGWQRRRSERTFVLAVALSGLLHDLGKPVADLMIMDSSGQRIWNPYRGSLMDWARTQGLTRYHLQWLRGRGARHRGFSLLILRHVVEPELFDRLREVGPELEASLIRILTQETSEDDPAALLVMRADQESTVRSLRDPRRETEFGGPSPERILIHAMRHLIHQAVWIPNVPGSPLWFLEQKLFLSWPRAANDLQALIQQEHLSGIPLDPELLMHFMEGRGLLAPLECLDDIPTPLQTVQPEGLNVPLSLLQLRSPSLLFDGILPESRAIIRNHVEYPRGQDPMADPKIMDETPTDSGPSSPIASNDVDLEESVSDGSALKTDLQNASDRYEWQIRDQRLFIPHPETARAMGIEPMTLIEALEAEDWLEPGGAGNLRKVRVLEGRRGLLLNFRVSNELLKAMKVPKRKSRRKVEASA